MTIQRARASWAADHPAILSRETAESGVKEGVVFRIYVDPEHRGEGVGRALLKQAKGELQKRGAERLTAMVLADNEMGQAFYERLGFALADEGETTIGGESYGEYTYRLDLPATSGG